MIRRVLSIVLYIFSGSFFYGVCLFSVIDGAGLEPSRRRATS